jgi:hypothetical protein
MSAAGASCSPSASIPVLSIIVAVTENRFFYTWIPADDSAASPEHETVMIRLVEIDERTKEALRKQLAT